MKILENYVSGSQTIVGNASIQGWILILHFSDIMHGSQCVCDKPKLLFDYIFNFCTMVHNMHNHFIEATIIYYDYMDIRRCHACRAIVQLQRLDVSVCVVN